MVSWTQHIKITCDNPCKEGKDGFCPCLGDINIADSWGCPVTVHYHFKPPKKKSLEDFILDKLDDYLEAGLISKLVSEQLRKIILEKISKDREYLTVEIRGIRHLFTKDELKEARKRSGD